VNSKPVSVKKYTNKKCFSCMQYQYMSKNKL
jgi:hypothetical protein